jgi:hypothetical protein
LNIQNGTLGCGGAFSTTGGALNFTINSATSFGQLALSGSFAANGTLGTIASGYSPKLGDSFPLITYASEAGIFNALNLPPDANWQIDYGQTVFTLYAANLTAPYLTLQVVTPPLINNAFTLLMLGSIGSNYTLQAATPPRLTNWVDLTNFVSVDTSFYYTDTTATNRPSHIFRAVMY